MINNRVSFLLLRKLVCLSEQLTAFYSLSCTFQSSEHLEASRNNHSNPEGLTKDLKAHDGSRSEKNDIAA